MSKTPAVIKKIRAACLLGNRATHKGPSVPPVARQGCAPRLAGCSNRRPQARPFFNVVVLVMICLLHIKGGQLLQTFCPRRLRRVQTRERVHV